MSRTSPAGELETLVGGGMRLKWIKAYRKIRFKLALWKFGWILGEALSVCWSVALVNYSVCHLRHLQRSTKRSTVYPGNWPVVELHFSQNSTNLEWQEFETYFSACFTSFKFPLKVTCSTAGETPFTYWWNFNCELQLQRRIGRARTAHWRSWPVV